MDDEDFQHALAGVKRFVRSEVLPREAEIDERDEIPESLRKQAAEMGLFGFAWHQICGGNLPSGRSPVAKRA